MADPLGPRGSILDPVLIARRKEKQERKERKKAEVDKLAREKECVGGMNRSLVRLVFGPKNKKYDD